MSAAHGTTLSAEEQRRIMRRPDPTAAELAPPTIPQPEVRARPARDSEVPQGARLVAKKAAAEGFDVSVTYARGPRLDQYWKVVEITDSILVQGKHADGRRFRAWWMARTGEKGKSAGVIKWGRETAYCHGVTGSCDNAQLNAYLVTNH